MYCQRCGNEIKDGSIICVHCGAEVKNTTPINEEILYQESANANVEKVTPAFSIIALVGSFLVPIVGLIFSIIGLKKYDKTLQPSDRGRCIAGLIISIASWVINFISYMLYLPYLEELLNELMYL